VSHFFRPPQTITSGLKDGAINVYFRKEVVDKDFLGTPEVSHYNNGNDGQIFISTGDRTSEPGNLTHGIAHVLGIAGGVNGYTEKTTGVLAFLTLTDSNSAESHVLAVQRFFANRLHQPYYGFASAKNGSPPTPVDNFAKRDLDVLREGAKNYLKK